MFCSLTLTRLRTENNVEFEAKKKELIQTEGPALLEVISDPDKLYNNEKNVFSISTNFWREIYSCTGTPSQVGTH
tara:strand:- start:2159 stop:2383 length:225 start_codon:yes stop_codon:yes gene_type:complete